MPFVVPHVADPRHRCCFREVHSKVGVLVILSLNAFSFTMLLVQTVLSSERSPFDVVFLLVQGLVILSTTTALVSNSRALLLPAMLFWLGLALSVLAIIFFAVLYAVYPNGFPSRFNLLVNHNVLEPIRNPEVDPEKLNMVRGVAITGVVMLCILFVVCLWFVGIHRKCYRYMREVSAGHYPHACEYRQRYSSDISDL